MTNPIWNQARWRQTNPVAKMTITSRAVYPEQQLPVLLDPAGNPNDRACKTCGHHVHDITCPQRLGARSSAAYPQVDKTQAKVPVTSKTLCCECLSLEAYQGSTKCYACIEKAARELIAHANRELRAEKARQDEMRRHEETLQAYARQLRAYEAQSMQQEMLRQYGVTVNSTSNNAVWNSQLGAQNAAMQAQMKYVNVANHPLLSAQAQACAGVREAESRSRNATDYVWHEPSQKFVEVVRK